MAIAPRFPETWTVSGAGGDSGSSSLSMITIASREVEYERYLKGSWRVSKFISDESHLVGEYQNDDRSSEFSTNAGESVLTSSSSPDRKQEN
jgi:hypothetical protein